MQTEHDKDWSGNINAILGNAIENRSKLKSVLKFKFTFFKN